MLKRFAQTSWNGRPSTPVAIVLRMLVVKHLYAFSYAGAEHWVSDSLVLRHFCLVYLEQVPDDTTLIRWANLIKSETLHTLLEHIVEVACQPKSSLVPPITSHLQINLTAKVKLQAGEYTPLISLANVPNFSSI